MRSFAFSTVLLLLVHGRKNSHSSQYLYFYCISRRDWGTITVIVSPMAWWGETTIMWPFLHIHTHWLLNSRQPAPLWWSHSNRAGLVGSLARLQGVYFLVVPRPHSQTHRVHLLTQLIARNWFCLKTNRVTHKSTLIAPVQNLLTHNAHISKWIQFWWWLVEFFLRNFPMI